MQKNIIIAGLCMFCLWCTACTDPFAEDEFMAFDEEPIGLYLESQPQYSQWVKLLKIADLFNAVNISNVKYTCFVANNDAVDTYIKANGWNTVDDLTENEAKSLLQYHIIPTDYAYATLSIGRLGTRTASGDYLTLSATLTDRYIQLFSDSVRVLKKVGEELPQINGYYHEIESVLDPIIYTLMEVIEQNLNYSIFAEALKATGLDVYLNRRDIDVENIKVRDYKAVMMVSDSIFYKKGIRSLADLNQLYEGEPTDVESDFYKFIGFHILPDAYDYGTLTEFTGTPERGANMETYINGEFISLEVNDERDSIFLNPLGPDTNLQIIPGKYNILSCNGFIHEVSGLMPPSEPIRYPFEWETTLWPEFNVVPFYQQERTRAEHTYEEFFFEEETEHIRWNTIPHKEDAIGYMSHDVFDTFWHDDAILFRLGPVGWVEFDTPSMMRGKYNIRVIKWAYNGSNDSGDGLFQMYIDGIKFGPIIDFRSGTSADMDMGDFVFPEAGSHVFRLRVTGLKGNGCIDRFIFTPINE